MLDCLKMLIAGVLLLGVGCTTTSITNLTPSDLTRTPSGLYRVEAAWKSNQKSIREGTVEPMVVMGETQYPMQPLPYAANRYETMIPVPSDQDVVFYHFKFNYTYSAIPQPKSNSKRSEEYRLEIMAPE